MRVVQINVTVVEAGDDHPVRLFLAGDPIGADEHDRDVTTCDPLAKNIYGQRPKLDRDPSQRALLAEIFLNHADDVTLHRVAHGFEKHHPAVAEEDRDGEAASMRGEGQPLRTATAKAGTS